MFKKYASAEITGVKGAPSQLGRSASLSKFADYEDFRTDDGYIYVRVRAISSRVNKNHDGWPSEELAKSYKTFLGKPNFVDHNNHDPERMRGVVVDAKIHVEDPTKTSALDPYYASAPKEHLPPTWIELLIETDAKAFPKLAKAIVNGEIDGVSMGCNVERSKCSHCGNWATNPDEYCQHIRDKGAEFDYYRGGQKTSKKSYEDCYDIGFFEISYVFDPADETALFLEKPRTSSLEKTACSCGCGDGKCGDPNGCKCGSSCATCHGSHESKEHWIQDAVKKPGQLHKDLGVPEDEDIPEDKLEEAEHSKSKKVRERAQFAENVKKKGSYLQARMERLADTNQIPQSEMTVAPEKVDTLRQEQVCPICGSMMEDGVCEVCNYEEPPEGFGNPDLTKAQDTDDMQQQQGLEAEDAQQDSMAVQQAQEQGQGMPQQPGSPAQPGMPMAASYNSNATNDVTSERFAADLSGGRVNTKEKPILPGTRRTTDKPTAQKTVSDSVKPVESSYTGEQMSDTTKTADNNAGEELTALGERVSPEAVGGVDGDENPEGHKTVSVDGVGAVDNDENPPRHKQVDLQGGLLNEVGPHTDTWSGNEGDSAGQQSPVTPAGSSTLGKRLEILSADTVEGDLATSGGKVMDLDSGLLDEVGEGTKTWNTADSFHETDPVTNQAFPTEGEVTGDGGVDPTGEPFPPAEEGVTSDGGVNPGKGAFPASEEGVKASRAEYRSHMITAMKLAETEIALGITPEDDKYDRIAELEAESSESLAARLDTVSKVKTAGLAKKVVAAKRPTPSFQTQSSLRSEPEEQDVDAEAIFS